MSSSSNDYIDVTVNLSDTSKSNVGHLNKWYAMKCYFCKCDLAMTLDKDHAKLRRTHTYCYWRKMAMDRYIQFQSYDSDDDELQKGLREEPSDEELNRYIILFDATISLNDIPKTAYSRLE